MNLLKEVDWATLKLDKFSQSDHDQETQDKITKLRAHKLEARGDPDRLREYIVKIDELIPNYNSKIKDKAEEFLQVGAQEPVTINDITRESKDIIDSSNKILKDRENQIKEDKDKMLQWDKELADLDKEFELSQRQREALMHKMEENPEEDEKIEVTTN